MQQFLLRKLVKTWDDVAEPRATLEDIDPQAVQDFLQKARESHRIRVDQQEADDLVGLLSKLNLMVV